MLSPFGDLSFFGFIFFALQFGHGDDVAFGTESECVVVGHNRVSLSTAPSNWDPRRAEGELSTGQGIGARMQEAVSGRKKQSIVTS
jgi:hypothetical protein